MLKFRAYSAPDKLMAKVKYIYWSNGISGFDETDDFDEIEVYWPYKEKNYEYHSNCTCKHDCGPEYFDTFKTAVWPNANDIFLMQHTGYQDKTKADIYEGDIFRVERLYNNEPYIQIGVINKIDTARGTHCSLVEKINPKYDVNYIVDLICISIHGEIIGNIYSNPELLEIK